MKKLLNTLSGAICLVAMSNVSAHPGHTSQLIHGHESLSLGISALVIAGVTLSVGYLVIRKPRTKQENQKRVPAKTRAE